MYAFLYAKQDQANISTKELAAFRKLATSYADVTDASVKDLLKKNLWVEICHA